MELSNEDQLRLTVLVRNVEAIRIDEQSMVVYGLSPKGEAKVPLNPTCKPERYVRFVREFLSGAVLGSPGGYPVHLQRWTRMGQMRDTNLAEMLMLGEPEAITAVVHAPGLTDDLARRAWWVAPTTENACRMLERECVVQGAMGQVLAHHLVEHLPFETEPKVIIDVVRHTLQPGLISNEARQRLWDKGKSQPVYRLGFLLAIPDSLPMPASPHPALAQQRASLVRLAGDGNAWARQLLRALDAPGQAFLSTVVHVLSKPGNQDVVIALFNAIGDYVSLIPSEERRGDDLTAMQQTAAQHLSSKDSGLASLCTALPASQDLILAMLTLAQVNENLLNPIFSKTTAVGTLMRRKIEPVADPLLAVIRQLHPGA
jgi:hypothetical protein